MKLAMTSLVVIGLVWVGVAYVAPKITQHTAALAQGDSTKPTPAVRTVKICRGNLLTTITATGTVKPEESVEVGAQLTGMVRAFGKDTDGNPLDFGSKVHKGDVLACIDDTVYQAQLDSAKASLVRANADLVQLRARCAQAKHDSERAESLRPDNAIAMSDYELAMTNYQVAEASVAVGEATLQQCEATKKIAEANLENTVIKSPIDGIVIDRRVNIGQTVIVSFFNSPGLFLIAKDLRKLKIWAAVKENDIGRIYPGMPVHITVDARPGETFDGKVDNVRLNATRAADGATFTVVVSVENSRDMLPYLTANLQFEVERHPNVLLVPNDALREDSTVDINALVHGCPQGDAAQPAPSKPLTALAAKAKKAWSRLLVKVGNSVRPIEVQVGKSDGAMTEIGGDNVKEGMDVVLGELASTDGV
jgi:HlyD family secretion protein